MGLLITHSSYKLNVQTIRACAPLNRPYPREEGFADAANGWRSYVLCEVAYLSKTVVRACFPMEIYLIWLLQD